ncbi:hypothetical protein H4R33_006894, partial [Dimargaris cristalligena]
IYDSDRCPKVAEAIEVVGVFEWTQFGEEGHAMQLPSIHAIYYDSIDIKDLCPPSPDVGVSSSLDFETIRTELIRRLSDTLGGDEVAAEIILLSMVATVNRVHNMPIGKFHVNLCNVKTDPAAESTPVSPSAPTPVLRPFYALLANCLPLSLYLPLALDFLNGVAFAPRSNADHLAAGLLQVTQSTYWLVDETAMRNGQLRDAGILNIRALNQVLTELKLEYEFPFQRLEFETEVKVLVVSEGKSFLPSDCMVPLSAPAAERLSHDGPSTLTNPEEGPGSADPMDWEIIRHYLKTCLAIDYAIDPEMAKKIQTDYVEERKQTMTNKEPTINQLDLSYRLTLAKLVAISKGIKELTDEIWSYTCNLDNVRKERVAEFEAARVKA